MNCDGCLKNCCKTSTLVLSEKDLEFFLSKFEDLKYFKYGPFIVLDEPCPCFKENKCSIYDQRPTICKIYPYTYEGKLGHCKAANTITKRDQHTIFHLIELETKRIWANCAQYPAELTTFNQKLQELRGRV